MITSQKLTLADAAGAIGVSIDYILGLINTGKLIKSDGLLDLPEVLERAQEKENKWSLQKSYRDGWLNERDPDQEAAMLVAELCCSITYEQAASPTRYKPGSVEKQALLAARDSYGLQIHLPGDWWSQADSTGLEPERQ